MGFFPCMGEMLWVLLTFVEVFPIPPLRETALALLEGQGGGQEGDGVYVSL
jgi:hypothetical protein